MINTGKKAIEQFYEGCRKFGIPIEDEEKVNLTKVWIITRKECTPVKWAPGPGISKEKLYSLPYNTLVYLSGYGFQKAGFLREHSVDYDNRTLRIVRVGDFKKSLEEL